MSSVNGAMSLEYAKELVSEDCSRIAEALDELANADPGLLRLTDAERKCWHELKRVAAEGEETFRVTRRGVRK